MFADCLLEEYENATATQSRDSQWMRQLLLPHLEKFHQVSDLVNILQSYTMSFIDLYKSFLPQTI